MSNEVEFWGWFVKHKDDYANLDDLDENKRENKLNTFLNQLHAYNNNLFFQIGSDDNSSLNELIITADGNFNYFEQVRRLVNAAPELKEWNIIAFKPPMGIGFKTRYKELFLDPRKIWFLPLENEDQPDSIGLKFFVPGYDPDKDQLYLEVMYQILDTILGEEICASNIKHIEVDHFPTNPIKDDYLELNDLAEYINWKIAKSRN